MMPELEHLIQKRAHEIWEQEGRPDGRHEEHWRQAAEEVTREVERMKADYQSSAAGGGAEGLAAQKGRTRRAKADGEASAPRARRTKAASAEEGTSAGQEAKPARRRAAKTAEGASAEPGAAPARTTRRRAPKAEGV
jgi:hypothetical protein